ncbi:hydroxyethylthiazole kinase [Ornithinimicrobium pratense]|uniref:Hydroxyethylthiazole kinase n=1 Tax=Ornithinimicrobium pratense TaxID=2593973 RepID=A0A5J6V3R1_9MICO|nr:hydroxyethylthiazole kinase [Ornithinimicrobium pratense]QFG68355.1 hydroxyethylthiazole kinase [Ornithinimicrobium pratense]
MTDRAMALAAVTATAGELADCWEAVRDQSPLTQCLTNIVAAPFVANVLLAAGASVAMVDNTHEAEEFAGVAAGVAVNLGTPYDDTVTAMRAAVRGAAKAGTPWVLDPVGAGGLPWRTQVARDLVGLAPPAVVRGNASEILGLTGAGGGRGVDSTDAVEDAVTAARDLATELGTTVAVSGPTDHLTDGQSLLRLAHGHPWMTRVTGMGCALGALMAACTPVAPSPLVGAATATAALTLAAETAAESTAGPGTFAAALLDELSLLAPTDLAARVELR